jgi:hypothetical protein
MATEKQITAAKRNIKKAQAANRKKGRRRGGGLSKRNGRKPVQRGITGRIGAFVLGALPPGLAALESGSTTMGLAKSKNMSMMGSIHYGVLRFVNNLSHGYFGIKAFPGAVNVGKKGGGLVQTDIGAGMPAGSLLTVSGVGLFMMLEDRIAAFLAGGRPVKILGTNYNATGGS